MKTGWKLLLLVAVAGIVSFSNSFKKETNPFSGRRIDQIARGIFCINICSQYWPCTTYGH